MAKMRIKSNLTGQEQEVTQKEWETIQQFYPRKHTVVSHDTTPPEAKADLSEKKKDLSERKVNLAEEKK